MTGPGTGAVRRLRQAIMGVRTRALVWFVVLFGALLLATVLSIRQVLVGVLHDTIEDDLVQEAQELRLLADGTNPVTGDPFGTDARAIFETFLSRTVPNAGEVLYCLVGGVPYALSPGSPVDLFADQELVARWAAAQDVERGDLSTEAGPVRWLAVPLATGEQVTGTFVVARFFQSDLDDIATATRTIGIVAGGLLLVAAVLGWFAAGSVVSPIRALTRAARRISDGDMSERIPVNGDDEIAELTDTFNQMVGRLDESFQTQRRFLDDVGHELRTPITIVTGHLETMPEGSANEPERRATIALCLDELDRMSRYVANLILLAKADKPDFLVPRPVDLTELTDGMLTRGRALAPGRRWVVDERAAAVIEADRDRLTQAWLNLLTNAIQHTGEGDEIGLGSAVRDGMATLWVRDTGPGVADEDRGVIFERFERGGDTTVRRDGTGLGLAIVAAIADAHGGTVELDTPAAGAARGSGATFRISVPTARVPADERDEVLA